MSFRPPLPWNPAVRPAPRPGRPRPAGDDPAFRAGASVVWLGDSLTEWWLTDGRGAWDRDFAGLPSLNLGVGGDSTKHLLWRMDNGLLDGLFPRLVVLLIGANNIGRDGPRRLAAGVLACADVVATRLPECPLLVLGLLPVGPRWNRLTRRTVPAVNARLAAAATGRSYQFLDVGPYFLDTADEVRGDLLPSVHLSPPGYVMLAGALRGPVQAALGV